MEHLSVDGSAGIFFHQNFQVFVKKSWNFWSFWNRFDIYHWPLHFLTLMLFLNKHICRIICWLLSDIGIVVIDWSWIFWQPKIFPRRFSGEHLDNWTPRFFRVHLLCFHNSLPQYPVYDIPLLVRLWNVKRWLHWNFGRKFSDFPTSFLLKIFWKRNSFQIKFCLF